MPEGRDRSQRLVRPNLHVTCESVCSLDERDALFDALRPLVEQGWQIDLTYSDDHQLTPRRVRFVGWLGIALIETRGQLGSFFRTSVPIATMPEICSATLDRGSAQLAARANSYQQPRPGRLRGSQECDTAA
jgi:hypothetical protein